MRPSPPLSLPTIPSLPSQLRPVCHRRRPYHRGRRPLAARFRIPFYDELWSCWWRRCVSSMATSRSFHMRSTIERIRMFW